MIGAPDAGLDQQRELGGQIGSRCRRADLVTDHPDGFALAGQAQHGVDEVAALAACPGPPIQPAGAHDVVLWPGRPNEQLAGQFARPVSAERIRGIGLDIRRALRAVKDVVGADVHQGAVGGSAGQGELLSAQGVDPQRLARIPLDVIDPMKSGGVQDELGLEFGDTLGNGESVADVQRAQATVRPGSARSGEHGVGTQGSAQIDAELAIAAQKEDSHFGAF